MKISAPSVTTSFLIIAICLVISGFSIIKYIGLLDVVPAAPQQQIVLPGLPDQSDELRSQPAADRMSHIAQRLLLPFVGIGLIAGVGVPTSLWLSLRTRQKRQRDAVRLQHLQSIGAALEQYFNRHGHYPVSTTYDQQYYSAININAEWGSYGFPDVEEMKQYDANWPYSDPAVMPTDHAQLGNYLYYPHHFGQRFSLYAHLEAPSQSPVPNYNVIDRLPANVSTYNYRFNGPDHHVESDSPSPPAATPPATPPNPPASPTADPTQNPGA